MSEPDPKWVEHRFLAEPRLALTLHGSVTTEELKPSIIVSIYQHNRDNTASWIVRGRAELGLVSTPSRIPIVLYVHDVFVENENDAWQLARKVYADLYRERIGFIQTAPTLRPVPPQGGKSEPS